MTRQFQQRLRQEVTSQEERKQLEKMVAVQRERTEQLQNVCQRYPDLSKSRGTRGWKHILTGKYDGLYVMPFTHTLPCKFMEIYLKRSYF